MTVVVILASAWRDDASAICGFVADLPEMEQMVILDRVPSAADRGASDFPVVDGSDIVRPPSGPEERAIETRLGLPATGPVVLRCDGLLLIELRIVISLLVQLRRSGSSARRMICLVVDDGHVNACQEIAAAGPWIGPIRDDPQTDVLALKRRTLRTSRRWGLNILRLLFGSYSR